MSLLSNVKTDANVSTVEEDTLGPSFILDSGVYEAVIDMAYLSKSQSSDALALNLKLKTREGTMLSERIWFTNKSGATTYSRDGQIFSLPGYLQVNSLATLVTGKTFMELADQVQEKQVMIYNYDEKKEIPTNAEVVVPLIGRKVQVGVLRTYEDVGDADNNWEPSGYSRETNSMDKFFDVDTSQTQGEKLEGKDAVTLEKWKARNEGVVRDRTANKVGLNPKPKGQKAGGAAATNLKSTNEKPTESLFNGKKEEATPIDTAAKTVDTLDDDIPF